jgi:D-alanine-D-alanine ligase
VRPRVWISVDYSPPDRFASCFDSAFEARQALREHGYPANLFSIREPLDRLPLMARDVIYPIAETCIELPDDPVGLRRLADRRGIPVLGSPWQAVQSATDKRIARNTISRVGIRVPSGSTVSGDSELDRVVAGLLAMPGLPAVAKPVTGRGGSIGVEYLPDEHTLRWRIRRFLMASTDPLLIEEYVRGTELTAWVLEQPGATPIVEILEITKDGPILDRHTKNGRQRAGLHVVENYPEFAVHRPPRIPPSARDAVQTVALALHRLFGAEGCSRTDLVLRSGVPVVLEINTTPRLRADSMLGMSAVKDGRFGAVLGGLAELAISRRERAAGGFRLIS